MFKKIIEEYENLKITTLHGEYVLADNKKELIKKIKYIQEIRNAIAHNHPFRNKGTEDIAIKYNYDGKAKEITLNQSFDMQFFNNYFRVSDILRGLSKELFKK